MKKKANSKELAFEFEWGNATEAVFVSTRSLPDHMIYPKVTACWNSELIFDGELSVDVTNNNFRVHYTMGV